MVSSRAFLVVPSHLTIEESMYVTIAYLRLHKGSKRVSKSPSYQQRKTYLHHILFEF